MDKLRSLVILVTAIATLTTVLGVVAVVVDSWQFVAILLFVGLLISVLNTLVLTRYLARNARTGEKRTRVAIQNLAARLKQSTEGGDKKISDLRELAHSTQNVVHAANASAQTELASLDERIAALEESVARGLKSSKHHTSVTVHDGTRQIESLLQLHQRYPHVQMPMPSTGRWAIDAQALAQLLALVEKRKPKRILELGSGTSTIWLGYLCQSIGGELITLEHLEEFLELTRTAVRRHELEHVIDSRLAPLEPTECDGQTFEWYSTDAIKNLADIDMVIIDGPPGSTGPQARYPALPKVIQLLAPNALVVLDDAHRDDERRIIESWLAAFPGFKQIEQGTSRLAVLERQIVETKQS